MVKIRPSINKTRTILIETRFCFGIWLWNLLLDGFNRKPQKLKIQFFTSINMAVRMVLQVAKKGSKIQFCIFVIFHFWHCFLKPDYRETWHLQPFDYFEAQIYRGRPSSLTVRDEWVIQVPGCVAERELLVTFRLLKNRRPAAPFSEGLCNC